MDWRAKEKTYESECNYMITIRYFAKLKEIVGKELERLPVESMTVAELIECTGNTYEGFIEHVKSCHVAINEEYAQHDDLIVAGDIVAFIPPVSGG